MALVDVLNQNPQCPTVLMICGSKVPREKSQCRFMMENVSLPEVKLNNPELTFMKVIKVKQITKYRYLCLMSHLLKQISFI